MLNEKKHGKKNTESSVISFLYLWQFKRASYTSAWQT